MLTYIVFNTNMVQVINESLRIISTAPTVLRVLEHDFQVGDYTIPAGWTFMGYPHIHFNSEKYEDPYAFNPWRWEVTIISYSSFYLFTPITLIKAIGCLINF